MNEEMQKIIRNVNLSWSKDYIIRYLYVNLAPFFKRDLKYFLASEEEKFIEYKKGFVNRGLDIVCSTISDFYVNLFNSFGIRAKKTAANSAKIPLFAVVVEGDHGWYFIDPLNDLFNNQYGLRTTEFGSIPHYNTLNTNFPNLISLEQEYIGDIDYNLGIDKSLSDYFDKLHLEMSNRNLAAKLYQMPTNDKLVAFERKMEFANERLINLGSVKGPFERIRLYLFLERIMFFKTEKKNLTILLDKMYSIPRPHIEYINPYNGEQMIFEEQIEQDKYVLRKIKISQLYN